MERTKSKDINVINSERACLLCALINDVIMMRFLVPLMAALIMCLVLIGAI